MSVENVCYWCGKKWLVKRSHALLRRHCSKACSVEAQKDKDWNMGRIKRKDNNHMELASAFESLGWSVIDLSAFGHGVPDLLIGQRGHGAHMVEVKNPKTQYGKKGLTRRQQRFQAHWGGDVHVVKNQDDVVALSATLRSSSYRNPGRIEAVTLSSVEDVRRLDEQLLAEDRM